MPKFIAVESGTLSNPYRFVQRGETVELTKEQAEFYKGSRWLRPYNEGKKKIDTPPFFPGVRMVGANNGGFSALDALDKIEPETSGHEQYNAQMQTIIQGEKDALGTTDAPSGEAGQEGTGNLDPIG